ncbi:MAG: T9SS type A sorting domain-containing protein, partial [Bacteroidota bacterium]
PFPGGTRQAAVAFSINNKGYVCTGMGFGLSYNDLWEYDATSNAWTQKSNMPTMGRHYACGFSVGNKAYIGTGIMPGAGLMSDFWEWDAITDTWTAKTNVPGFARVEASAFSLGGFGYLGMGSGFGSYYADFYQYNPTTDTWIVKASYGAGPTEEATQFSIGGAGYVGTGYDGVQAGVVKNDFWAYVSENNPSGLDENHLTVTCAAYPNPCTEQLEIEMKGGDGLLKNISITDLNGNMILIAETCDANYRFDVSRLAAGTYLVHIKFSDSVERNLLITKK